VPDLLVVVLIPPLLILVTLLLAHVEKRITASRQRPTPPSPAAPGTRSRRRRRHSRMTLEELPGAWDGAQARDRATPGRHRVTERIVVVVAALRTRRPRQRTRRTDGTLADGR
jgi:hypothetical protein